PRFGRHADWLRRVDHGIGEPGRVAERVRVRELDDDEGQRLVRIIRRGTGSMVTWRRVQMILLSAQGMAVAKIAEVAFTSADRVRDVIHNFGCRRVRLAVPEIRRWSTEDIHTARTPRDQEDRHIVPDRTRPTIL